MMASTQKTAVAAHDDPCLGAAPPEGRHDFFQCWHDVMGRAVIGGAQLRPERDAAAERVDRQVNVIIVIGVAVAAFLQAVEPVPKN